MKMTLATLPVRSPMEKVFSGVVEFRFDRQRPLTAISEDKGPTLINSFLSRYLGLHDIISLNNSGGSHASHAKRPNYSQCEGIINQFHKPNAAYRRDDVFDGFFRMGVIVAPEYSLIAYQPRNPEGLSHVSISALTALFPSLGYDVVGLASLRNAEAIGNGHLKRMPPRTRVRNP